MNNLLLVVQSMAIETNVGRWNVDGHVNDIISDPTQIYCTFNENKLFVETYWMPRQKHETINEDRMESSKCAHFGFGSSLSVCCCCCAFNSSCSKFMTYFSVHSKDNSFLWWHRLSFFMFCCRFACRFYLSFDTMLTGNLYIRMPMPFFASHFLLLHNKRHFGSISNIFAYFFFSRYGKYS